MLGGEGVMSAWFSTSEVDQLEHVGRETGRLLALQAALCDAISCLTLHGCSIQ